MFIISNVYSTIKSIFNKPKFVFNSVSFLLKISLSFIKSSKEKFFTLDIYRVSFLIAIIILVVVATIKSIKAIHSEPFKRYI